MKLIVGLGNQGMTYHRTRHNVGFMVIDALARRHNVSLNQQTVESQSKIPASVYGDYRLDEETVRMVMPLTMMNDSGFALKRVDVPFQDILIVCDDVNLPLGSVRLRPQGGPGGHHGLESCIAALGTEAVPRLRVGVGAERMPSDLSGFVLSNFGESERPLLAEMIQSAADACEAWATEGVEKAMNRFNKVQE